MKCHFLLLIFIINIVIINAILTCPCEFSPEDTRPFFEQYETETTPQPTDKKEEPCIVQ